jgi:hypothetical protein
MSTEVPLGCLGNLRDSFLGIKTVTRKEQSSINRLHLSCCKGGFAHALFAEYRITNIWHFPNTPISKKLLNIIIGNSEIKLNVLPVLILYLVVQMEPQVQMSVICSVTIISRWRSVTEYESRKRIFDKPECVTHPHTFVTRRTTNASPVLTESVLCSLALLSFRSIFLCVCRYAVFKWNCYRIFALPTSIQTPSAILTVTARDNKSSTCSDIVTFTVQISFFKWQHFSGTNTWAVHPSERNIQNSPNYSQCVGQDKYLFVIWQMITNVWHSTNSACAEPPKVFLFW